MSPDHPNHALQPTARAASSLASSGLTCAPPAAELGGVRPRYAVIENNAVKFAVWTYTAAISLASFAVAVLGGMFGNSYQDLLSGKPLPPLTEFLLEYHFWALAVPLPWFCAAIWLSRRGVTTPDRVFAFAGTSTLALVSLFAFSAVALTLPFVRIIQLHP